MLALTLVEQLRQVRTLQQQGRLAEAETLCQQAVQSSQRAVDAVHFLGLIKKQRGDLESAETLLLESLDGALPRADHLANLANLLVARGRLAEAERVYRAAIDQDRRFVPAYFGLGQLLLRVSYFAQAENWLSQLVELQPNDGGGWILLGDAKRHNGAFGLAALAYERARQCQPTPSLALHKLATLRLEQGRIDQSLTLHQQARVAGLAGDAIDLSEAQALQAAGDDATARDLLARAIRRQPDSVPLLKMMTQLRYRAGDRNFAAELDAAAKRPDASTDIMVALVESLRSAGQLALARAELVAAIKVHPSAAELYGELATVEQLAGAYDAALAAAEQAMQLSPEAFRLSPRRIDPLLSLGRAEQALPLIEAARERWPSRQWYIAAEITALRMLGRSSHQALSDYDQLVQVFELPAPAGFEHHWQFAAALSEELKRLHQAEREPLDQSLRNGTQTTTSLLASDTPLIRQLLTLFADAVEAYRQRLSVTPDHPLASAMKGAQRFNGCWSVQLHRDGFHVNHLHSRGTLSSVYYVQLPDEVADEEATSGWLKFGEPRFATPGVGADHLLQPKVGRLVLFPSYFWHGTTPIQGDQSRLTVAFDAVFDG